MKFSVKVLLVAGIASLAAGGAFAQDAKQAIKARKAYMQLNAFYLGQLGAMAKGEVEYDAEKASAIANSIAAVSSVDQSALWPQGSDNVSMPDETRALPAIWETYPAIAEKGAAYGEAVQGLVAAAGGGLDALRGAMGDVGKGCGGCHDDFRQPMN